MTRLAKTTKPKKHHSDEFKAEAIKLAETIGFAQAADDLGIYSSQLYQWRQALNNKRSMSERESALAAENAKLKRELAIQKEELAILKKAASYFARNQK